MESKLDEKINVKRKVEDTSVNNYNSKIPRLTSKQHDTKTVIDKWIKEYQCLFTDKISDIQSYKDNFVANDTKLTESSTKQVLNSWINEYFTLFSNSDKVNSKNDLMSHSDNYVKMSTENPFLINEEGRNSFHPVLFNPNQFNKVGYWGPLLRYGTYGIYRRYFGEVFLKKKDNVGYTKALIRTAVKVPLVVPEYIRIPRHAMLSTLTNKAVSSIWNLKEKEKDSKLIITINYSNILESITNDCGTCPLYIYTKLFDLPTNELSYFTDLRTNQNDSEKYLSFDGNIQLKMMDLSEFYACELYISDIIVAQTFARWKSAAKEACSRIALKLLDHNCHLVGCIRYWKGTDFLTAGVSHLPPPHMPPPLLPPFLTDPTEPLFKKDQRINFSDSNESFQIVNPKPIHDFWLYAPLLTNRNLIKTIDPCLLLHQSAEFSQMHLSYELHSSWDETFSCCIMLDKTLAIEVMGLGSLEQACYTASLILVDKLISSQPLVVLQPEYHNNYQQLIYGIGSNEFITNHLMWNEQKEKQPISISTLIERLILEKKLTNDKFRNLPLATDDLKVLLMNYAQSSLLCSIGITQSDIIDIRSEHIGIIARQTGLLVINTTTTTLICKQIPHIMLKANLLCSHGVGTLGQYGIWKLLWLGNMTSNSEYCQVLTDYYHSNDQSISIQDIDYYSSTLFEPANQSQLSSDLIPGIDF